MCVCVLVCVYVVCMHVCVDACCMYICMHLMAVPSLVCWGQGGGLRVCQCERVYACMYEYTYTVLMAAR